MAEDNDEDRTISVPEAAAILGVGLNTVRRWLEAGELRGGRLSAGRHWRVSYRDTMRVRRIRRGENEPGNGPDR